MTNNDIINIVLGSVWDKYAEGLKRETFFNPDRADFIRWFRLEHSYSNDIATMLWMIDIEEITFALWFYFYENVWMFEEAILKSASRRYV